MRKSTKLLKRLAALFLVVLMSIDSFAAVVSDNDGAAFITKAEFDSLSIDFQNQISEKNKNIDDQIDSAISAYVAGAKASKKSIATNLVKQAEDVMGKQILWGNTTSINSATCDNRSVYEFEMICARTTQNHVGLWTCGYDIDNDSNYYTDGYKVLKATTNGVMYRTSYRPLMRFYVSYFAYYTTGDNSADCSSWSSQLGSNQNQFDTLPKSWVGYMNNKKEACPVLYTEASGYYIAAADDTHDRAWRTVTRTFVPSENKLDFKMYPYCSTNVAVWYSDNTQETIGCPGGDCRTSHLVYNSDIKGGTNASTAPYSSVNHPLHLISGNGNDLAWVKKNQPYNEQILDLNGQSTYPCAMKYGLPLVRAQYKGKLKYSLSINPGDFAIYKGTPKIFADVTSNKRSVSTVTYVSDEISVDAGDTVFVIYAPNTESRLVFDELYYEVE